MLVLLKDITGPSLDPLQFAYRANRSVDDAVNMGIHYVLHYLDRQGTYVRILFVDFSSAFNTIIPYRLTSKLTQISMPTSVCQWIDRQAAASEAGGDDRGLQEKPLCSPPLMHSTVTAGESFRYLGTTISQDLKWANHIDS